MKTILSFLFVLLAIGVNGQFSQDGLLAYYSFDGNVLDTGPNGYVAQNFGGSFAEDSNGNANAAIKLNGIDQFVDLSNFANVFRDNLPEATIYFKVKFDKQEDSQTILSLSNQGESLETNVFEFEYENQQIQLETEIGSAATNFELGLEDPQPLLNNEWHEILITISGNSLVYCRNGETIYDGIYTPAQTTVEKLSLGCYNGTGDNACCFFGGSIDELQFYNRVLSKDELIVGTSNPKENISSSLFPNPTHGIVNLSLTKFEKDLTLTIFDSKGKVVAARQMKNSKDFQIQLPTPSGVYFIQVKGVEDHYPIQRVVKF